MTAISNLITIADEIKAMILGLDLSYFEERGANNIRFHEPSPRESGELEDATSRAHSRDETRRFVILTQPGFIAGRWDGTEAPVNGRLDIRIRYRLASASYYELEHMYRMASRDSEVIGHEILTMDFTARHVGQRVPQRPPGGLRQIGTSNLYLSVLTYDIDYHYDGS